MTLVGHPLSPLEAVILALAAYRVTRLIVVDTLLNPLRSRILARWPAVDDTAPTTLLVCGWCSGVWVAAFELLSWRLWPTVTLDLAWVAAVAAVVGIVMDRA